MTDTPDHDGPAEWEEATPGHLLCLGLGYSARMAVDALRDKGWRITGTTRDDAKADALRRDGIAPVLWQAPAPIPREAVDGVTDILVSIRPDETGCPALTGLKPRAERIEGLRSIIYLSSSGVYGDHDGGWVDEEGPLLPGTQRGRRRLKAEHLWEDFAAERGAQHTSLRLAGIYGPGRNALETLLAQQEGAPAKGMGQRVYKPGQVFSRVHVADIAAIITALFARAGTDAWPEQHHAINVADDLPSPPHEVLEYAADLLGIEPPPLVSLQEADLSPMARSFYEDNKRVSNALVKQVLGHDFAYPSYREGLSAILRDLKR